MSERLDGFFFRPDEEVPASLAFEGQQVEAVPVREEPLTDFLAFRLEKERYAVPITDIREILKPATIAEVPRGGPQLLGVTNLRGEIAPIYDVKVRLKLAPRAPKLAGPPEECAPVPRSARVLVLAGEGGTAGVYIDEVLGVVRLRASSIEPAPPGVGHGERDCITGIGRREGELYVLLDLGRAIA